jgi:hypothetical protein
MNINVYIERLILDGVPVAAGQESVLLAGFEAELIRLLGKEGLSGISASALERLSGGTVQLDRESKPALLGQQVAQSIYTAMGPNGLGNRSSSDSKGRPRK